MSEKSNSRAVVLSALLVSLAVVIGSYLVASALDRTTAQVELAADALRELPAAGAPSAQRPRPQRGPDRAKQHEVEVGESPVLGKEDAAVTIVEWSDFQCPFCNRALPTLKQIQSEYGDRVRIVFKHLPLSIHPQAPAAHAASEAAHRQGKFWEMHDRIFENQRDLNPATFERYAQEMGLDVGQFKKDVASASVKQRIEEDESQASKLGVTGTPAFFINGRFLSGAQPFANFKRVIDGELEKES